MNVKCRGCGNSVDRDIAFKIVINGKNNYYCNEEEYQHIGIEKKSRVELMSLLKDIIGETTNTVLFKELKFITDIYGNKKVLDYLTENKINLQLSMNKNFQSEFGRIRYFFAIIKNNIGDFVKIKITNNSVDNINIDYTPIKYKQRQRKKCLKQYLDDFLNEENGR